jgi:glutamyl-tRNA synthetase
MTAAVRTRFAPSPTGYLHIGSIRTALFAWLLARHHGGSFILRVEDTDVERLVAGAIEYQMEALRWMGLNWDEGPDVGGKYGPYVQSQRLALYQDAAKRLVESGHAYYCYCSPERLEALRAEQVKRKLPPGYDRRCRNLTPEQRRAEEARGITPVVRFKVPLTGRTSFHDEIWGNVVFDNSHVEDLVLLKSDGYPTYHLGNVVDDHAMDISHVIRDEGYLSSTPLHLMTYEALGYTPPRLAHVPLVLGPDRTKLSKRHGSDNVLDFREQGYLPEALMNFLALVGWSLDDKTDIISREDLVRHFSLERVSKTPAVFNHEKLKWMNGVYIRKLPPGEFARLCVPFLEKSLPDDVRRPLDFEYVQQVTALVQERARLLSEVPGLSRFFFTEGLSYPVETLIGKGMDAESTRRALSVARERLESVPAFDAAALEGMLRPLAEELKLKTGQLFGALRTAVSGETATPPLFQMMAVLGRARCLARIDAAVTKLAG